MIYIPILSEKLDGNNGHLKSTYWYKNGRKIVIVCKSIKFNFSRVFNGW